MKGKVRIFMILCNVSIVLIFFLVKISDDHVIRTSAYAAPATDDGYTQTETIARRWLRLPDQVATLLSSAVKTRPFRIDDYVMHKNACAPLDDAFDCVQARFQQMHFPMCIYKEYEDTFISRGILSDGLWESGNVEAVVQELKTERAINRSAAVTLIDVGANLGSFTVTAAHLGYHVVAVEPTPRSVRRLMSSLIRGGPDVLKRVQLVAGAVSDERRVLYEKIDYSNKGRAQLVNETECKDPNWNMVADLVNNLQIPYICDLDKPIHTVYLDDLIPLIRHKRAILKIDIEGHEHLALKKAAKLFDAKDIIAVHMEWVFYKLMLQANTTHANRTAEVMIEFFVSRGYAPEAGYGGMVLDLRYWMHWPDDVTWRKHSYMRRYAQTTTQTNHIVPQEVTAGSPYQEPTDRIKALQAPAEHIHSYTGKPLNDRYPPADTKETKIIVRVV